MNGGDYFPVILGQGSLHDLNDKEDGQQSRLWGLKSTSKAACIAADKRADAPKSRPAGFVTFRAR